MRKITEFPKLVIDEAKNLRKHTTVEEKEKLDFGNLDASLSDNCIYGQLTGNCFSDRASELIMKCAKRVYINKESEGLADQNILNGKPKKPRNLFFGINYWSPIEIFIAKVQRSSDSTLNERLLNYIKGKRRTL